MNSAELYSTIIDALKDKKGRDMISIDIEELTTMAHYFIICSGTSDTHIKTLADNVEEKLKAKDFPVLHKEGYNSARWILLDYGDIVVHVFHQEDRSFYDLERLWQGGKKTVISDMD